MKKGCTVENTSPRVVFVARELLLMIEVECEWDRERKKTNRKTDIKWNPNKTRDELKGEIRVFEPKSRTRWFLTRETVKKWKRASQFRVTARAFRSFLK